jgi:hypothetical protein
MKITAGEARDRLDDIELRFTHGMFQKQEEWRKAVTWLDERDWYPNRVSIVSEYYEDYVFDALFDVPNR